MEARNEELPEGLTYARWYEMRSGPKYSGPVKYDFTEIIGPDGSTYSVHRRKTADGMGMEYAVTPFFRDFYPTVIKALMMREAKLELGAKIDDPYPLP